jgi:hypothetical protein
MFHVGIDWLTLFFQNLLPSGSFHHPGHGESMRLNEVLVDVPSLPLTVSPYPIWNFETSQKTDEIISLQECIEGKR